MGLFVLESRRGWLVGRVVPDLMLFLLLVIRSRGLGGLASLWRAESLRGVRGVLVVCMRVGEPLAVGGDLGFAVLAGFMSGRGLGGSLDLFGLLVFGGVCVVSSGPDFATVDCASSFF